VYSESVLSPGERAGKVSAAEVTDRQKRDFSYQTLAPFSWYGISRDFLEGYTATRPPFVYWTA